MIPQVDIKKVRDLYFNYSVSTGSADDRHARQGLLSIAECIHDAASALGHHFPMAAISYEGRALGCFRVAHMEHRTAALTEALLAKLAELTCHEQDQACMQVP